MLKADPTTTETRGTKRADAVEEEEEEGEEGSKGEDKGGELKRDGSLERRGILLVVRREVGSATATTNRMVPTRTGARNFQRKKWQCS